MIIRQRGRRRISLNWSPEKNPSSHSSSMQPRTPTTTMTLRSSPKKRLHLADGTIIQTPLTNDSPRKVTRSSISAIYYTPQTKRFRLTDYSIAQRNTKAPVTKLLKGLSKSQLINIIQDIITNEPQIEQNVRNNLPMPDIKPMEELLIQLKKNIFKSLPSSRLVKNTDSASYSRASIHLNAFKKQIIEQSRQLNDSEHWDALIDYCLMAWPLIRVTPIWENNSHNAMRRSCFKILSWHCLCALKNAGHQLGNERLNIFYSNIETMQIDCDDIGSCANLLIDALDTLNDDLNDTIPLTSETII